ncbi:penicillin acylase family protein [Enhygromyxa salina]|uniref:penicillin acylase family protein n=1 Tax=Enhygromyxa salina TaxID=215803 RepID=UPI0015E7D789|nr:penicillin acylase family protein [Enhygromyxa salina]
MLSLPLALSACKGDDTSADQDTGTGETGDEPQVEPFDEFPGLTAEVQIHIDDRGIPHIYGATDNDVAYASGYQMATDRLFEMDLLRRRALGRQAEVLGEAFVDQDIISRTFNLTHWGHLNAERVREESPDVYNYIISWLAGVNARVDQVNAGEAPLPYGFAEAGFAPEQWQRDDEYAIGKLMYLGNSNSLERDLLATILRNNLPETWNSFELGKPMFPVAIMPEDEIPQGFKPDSGPSHLHKARPPQPMDPYSPAAIGETLERLHRALGHIGSAGPFGSNNWAIDGRHTDSGRSMIANDPHQPLQSPSLMYAQHLNSIDEGTGTQDVIGFSFAGTMGVQLGHNRSLHWAATTNFADVMDLWDVRVEGEGVWAGDNHVDWVVREEPIEVAGGEPVILEVQDVPGYGVIVPDSLIPLPVSASGRKLLVNWTGFAATNEEACFARMSAATDIPTWEAGVDLMEVAGFNFVAATADAISYRVQIKVPDRDLSNGALPYVVIDGDNASSYWTSYLPAEQLPRSHAASRGWIASANNDPWGFTFDGDVTNDPFYYGYFYAAGHRAKRLQDEFERLTAQGSVTKQDMIALQLDTHSTMSDVLLPIVLDAAAQVGTNPDLAEFEGNDDIQTLAAALASWDQTMERDSAGALIWHAWLHNMAWEAVEDDLAFLYTLVFEAEPPYIIKIPALAMLHQYSTDNLLQTSRDWIAVEGLRRTADWLNATYGGVDPDGYSWGAIHGTRFDNPFGGELDGGWTATNGGEDTLNVSSSNFYAGPSGAAAERFDSHSGPIFRIVTTFAEDGTPEATVNFPRGNSADPSSPHWDDTLADWTNGVYTPLPFRRAEVEAATQSSYTLSPGE